MRLVSKSPHTLDRFSPGYRIYHPGAVYHSSKEGTRSYLPPPFLFVAVLTSFLTFVLHASLSLLASSSPLPARLTEQASSSTPVLFLMFGTNGAGKTTSSAKLAHMLLLLLIVCRHFCVHVFAGTNRVAVLSL